MTARIVSHFLAHYLSFILLFNLSWGLYEIEVHRMFGYEQDDVFIGSKVQTFTMVAAHFAGESFRKLALIHFNDIDTAQLETLFSKKPGGLLIILPYTFMDAQKETAIWELIYTVIGPKAQNLPVYFCWENEEVLKIYQSPKVSEEQQEFKFTVGGTEPKQINQLTFEDIYATFDDISSYKQSNPSLMIVVGGDSHLSSGELQVPLKNRGFQLQLFFSLVRNIKQIYQSYQKREQNILFYFTYSSTLDQEGLKRFFEKPENQRLANSVENILILDNLFSSGPYFLDYQQSAFKPSDDEQQGLNQIITLFSKTAQQLSVPLQVRFKPSSLLNDRDVNIYKLSSLQQDKDNVYLTNHLQSKKSYTDTVSTLVYQVIVRTAYGLKYGKDESNYEGLLQISNDQSFTQGINDFFNKSNTFITKVQKDSTYVSDVSKIFSGIFKNPQKSTYIYKKRKYYTSEDTKATVIRFISAFLDLYFFAGLAIWLSAIYVFFKQFNIISGVNDVYSERTKSKKPKQSKRD